VVGGPPPPPQCPPAPRLTPGPRVTPGNSTDPLLLAAEARRLQYRPLISVLVPVYNTAPAYLTLCVDSVLDQAYPEWELILCDDGSTRTETQTALTRIASLDSRIRVHLSEVNHGISSATNKALADARGEFVAMLDHDDEMLPGALFEVAKALNADRSLDVIYTDQDHIEADGGFAEAFYKPDWSLELFRGVMYVGHLLVVRRSLANEIGGFDQAFDHVQDFEFMLRLAEKTTRISHVPKVLYHWRKIPGSLAYADDEKKNIGQLQAAAVNAHLTRCSVEATARPNPEHAHRLLITPRSRTDHPLASIVVRAPRQESFLAASCERLIAEGAYPAKELVVVVGDTSFETRRQLESLGAIIVATHQRTGGALSTGLMHATGDLIISFAGDLRIETPDWLEHLLFGCQLPGVACVTPVVLSSDGTVASAGSLLGGPQVTMPAMRGWRPETDGYAGSLSCVREISAVPGDCFAITRSALDYLGGLNRYLLDDHYQAVDLSLRARSAGMRNLCTPRVLVRHGDEQPSDHAGDALDAILLSDVWRKFIEKGDPYHNRNFQQSAPGYQT
jgi:glycosyltransferase involved in cell wall biosynthesis